MTIFSNILQARQKQAELCVHAHLASFDDTTLSKFGINRKELKKGGSINYFM